MEISILANKLIQSIAEQNVWANFLENQSKIVTPRDQIHMCKVTMYTYLHMLHIIACKVSKSHLKCVLVS